MEENGENNYTLTIHDVGERNLGDYTCQAFNKIGDASSTISLKGNKLIKYFFIFPAMVEISAVILRLRLLST